MANNTVIRDAYGAPAIFVGSKTGSDDAPFVFIRVGDEERRMRWTEWDALPPWTGPRPAWATKKQDRQSDRLSRQETDATAANMTFELAGISMIAPGMIH